MAKVERKTPLVRAVPDSGPVHSIPRPMNVAQPAKLRRRHKGAALSFLILVILPVMAAGFYLYYRALDQYASHVGFAVRSEEAAPAFELLGGIAEVPTGASSDADILYKFVSSQQLVSAVHAQLDLASIWTRDDDEIFSLGADTSIEALMSHWSRKVAVSFDSGTGLTEIRVLAFTPQDAQSIASAIQVESGRMINALSDTARADAMSYASQDLSRAEARLVEARSALSTFRTQNQLVDPTTDLKGQLGVLSNLQGQLAEAMIETDMLRNSPRAGGFRTQESENRVETIRAMIAAERTRIAAGNGAETKGYASLVGDYERLAVEVEFAQSAYLSALSIHEKARAEAQRKTRYLAAYIEPTLAQTPQYPQRVTWLMLVTLASLGLWALLSLVFYGVRDRR